MNSQERRKLRRYRAKFPTFTFVESREKPLQNFFKGWIDFMATPISTVVSGQATKMSFTVDFEATNCNYPDLFAPPPLYSIADFRRDCQLKNRPWKFTGKINQQPSQR